MVKRTRFIVAIIDASKQDVPALPWQRRRAERGPAKAARRPAGQRRTA